MNDSRMWVAPATTDRPARALDTRARLVGAPGGSTVTVVDDGSSGGSPGAWRRLRAAVAGRRLAPPELERRRLALGAVS